MIRKPSVVLGAVLALTACLSAGEKQLSGYQSIVIEPFKADPELVKAKFPAEYEDVLQKTLFARLLSERLFQTVVDSSMDPESARSKSPGALIASGEVVGYSKGNRAARVIINYGAGSARIKVALVFRDAATGKDVLRIEQEGSYAGFANLTGGSAQTAQNESARKVVDGLIKKIRNAK